MQSMIISTLMLFLVGCAATTLKPEAEKVRILQNEPKGCKYLGEVTGNQGNFLTGSFTSNENLETGARNELKNQAAQMGANTLVILTSRAGQTMSDGRLQQTNVTLTATAFHCLEGTI